MNQSNEIAHLVFSRQTAALGTLHEGVPFVSMVPVVWSPILTAFVIHVSKLASHTGDMLAQPRVSLLITAPETEDVPAQALPRLTIQGLASLLDGDTDKHATAKAAYLERFPAAAPIFQLGDFSLFAIEPVAVRHIAGFGRASSMTPAVFASALALGS